MSRCIYWGMAFVFLSLSSLVGKSEPDFLIIGVAKCGTTTLYDWITQHPDIKAREPKELHFFDKKMNYKKGIEWYQKHFSDNQISGDATPTYFFKDPCAKRIAKHCPHSKLILICRDPVKRVISGYFMHQRKHKKLGTFEEFIACKTKVKTCLKAGMYALNLEYWLRFFPREQIHIMFLEEMATDPQVELNKVFQFLGLKEYRLESYDHEAKASYNAEEINPETIASLKKLYKPHNEAFAKLLGRELPWKE